MIQSACFIFCNSRTKRNFLHAGVAADRLDTLKIVSYPPEIYNAQPSSWCINRHLDKAREELKEPYHLELLSELSLDNYDPSLPTIGMYGKSGESKGTYDLISALGSLKKQNHKFNLLILTSLNKQKANKLLNTIQQNSINKETTWLPFMPHWEVPSFIKKCDAICFLERDFSISIHTPGIVKEVLLCGGCLILSREISDKQLFRDELKDNENILLTNPKDNKHLSEKLKLVIENRSIAKRIGKTVEN